MFDVRARGAALVWLGLTVSLYAQNPPPKPPVAPPKAPNEINGKTFVQWMADLKHADPSVRTEAILHVSLFGEEAKKAVPLLLDRCQDRDGSPRVKAVKILNFIPINDEDIAPAVKALGRVVQTDQQSIIRYEAIMTLMRFADYSNPILGAVISATKDNASYEIRRAAVILLRKAGLDANGTVDAQATHALIAALRDPTVQVRLEAVIGLGTMGKPTDTNLLNNVLSSLHSMVKDSDKAVGIWARFSIMALDKVSDTHLHAIIKQLKAPEVRYRLQAARALGAMGTNAKAAVPDLVDMLEDSDKEAVGYALLALGQVGESDSRALATLTQWSKRKDEPHLRMQAIQGLGYLGRAGVPTLLEMAATEKDRDVLAATVQALGSAGDGGPRVFAALDQLRDRQDVDDNLKKYIREAKDHLNNLNKK